ncbi:unnamed protein product, partial [Didymodactylos carnosus]
LIRKGGIKYKKFMEQIENEAIFDRSSVKLCQLLENMDVDTSKTTQNDSKDLYKKVY